MNLQRMSWLLSLAALFNSPSVWACAMCFSSENLDQARAMSLGILTLLVILLPILGSIFFFMIYLIKKQRTSA